MVAVWSAVTAPAVMVKVDEVEPAVKMVALPTVTLALSLLILTTVQPTGASLVSSIVQVATAPVLRADGLQDSAAGMTSGVRLSESRCETPFSDAVIEAAPPVVTVPVLALNVLMAEPAAMVTVEGAETSPLSVASETVTLRPEVTPESPTMQSVVALAPRVVWAQESALSEIVGAVRSTVAVRDTLPRVAVTVAD
jgi:hypothetical protein